jgi:hypothetical protein
MRNQVNAALHDFDNDSGLLLIPREKALSLSAAPAAGAQDRREPKYDAKMAMIGAMMRNECWLRKCSGPRIPLHLRRSRSLC